MKKDNGFTLIEVLIALFIIAIALAAVIKTTSDAVRGTSHVHNTMAAHWVAMNLLSEMQTNQISLPTSAHSISGATKMLNQSWNWTASVDSSVKIIGSERIIIHVYLNNKLINSVAGFVA